MYVGHAFHRLSPVFRIKFKSGGSQPTTQLKTINGENLTGTGDIQLQVPITTRADDLVFDATETNRLQLASGRITEIANKVNKTDVGDVSQLTTTAKTLVPAVNEINAKGTK